MNNISSLEEILPNNWWAKYHGNFGIYIIRMTLKGKRITRFSCSCPSDYYPCKHIAIVKEAILERIAGGPKTPKKKEMTVEELLKDVPREELYDFLAGQARRNPELINAILLKFSHKASAGSENENSYSLLLRKALENTDIYDEDLLDYNANVEIDALEQWLDKAQAYAEQGNYREAVLISKACIEEYAEWLKKVDSDIIEYINTDYQTIPFEILDNALTNSGIGARELFDYCRAEMMKPKYSGSDMFDEFNDLLMTLSVTVNPGGFIDLQNELLSKLQDKSSYKAKRILQRKIDFYTLANQPEKAWEVIEKNIQVEDYRKKVVEKKLRERQFAEAKKLILDFISSRGGRGTGYWHELLLHIAQNGKNSKSTVKRGVYDTI